MKKYIALLLVFVMLLLAACGTTQPPADDTTPSTSATTGSTEPDGTEATQGDTTAATENVTQPSADGTGSTEPSTKPTDGSSTDGTEKPTEPKPTEGTKPSDPPAPEVKLSLNKTTLSLEVGKTATITATYSGASGKPTWSSSKTSVATVDSNGKVTAKAAGTAYISVTYGGKTAQCAVTVTAPNPIVNLSLDKTTISLEVGKTATLTATYSGASGTPTWEIDSGSNVVSISGSGKSITITAKKAGTAFITASYGGKKAQCAVTVTAPAPTVGTLTINTPNNTVVKVDSTLQLDYSYTGDEDDLTFMVADSNVLSVSNTGLITGKAAGKTDIYIHAGNTRLGSVRIKVEKSGGSETGPAAEKIVLDGTTAPWMGVAGNYMTFTAHAKTSGSNQKVTATSSNTSVATVSLQSTDSSNWCTFKVSFKSGGSTTITITSADGKASTSYTVSVSGGYSCNPGGGQLTPEQFVSAVNGVMRENGATIDTSMGYRVATLDASQLTWSNARSSGEAYFREFWGNGSTRMGLSYQGVNEDGKHVFYIHR